MDSGLQHELLSALKDLAIELGRTPTKNEFCDKITGGHYRLAKAFGTYSALVQAAGLETYSQRRTPARITDKIFVRDLKEHLEAYEPRPTPPVTTLPKVAIMGDLHEPFSRDDVKKAFFAFVKEFKPEYVVQIGDAIDAYSHAKFPRSHNIFTPKAEEDLARSNLEAFWSEIKKVAPSATCVMLLGNHAIRPLKRVLESVPSIEHWAEKYLTELMTFDGVHTVMDPREEYKIGDVTFIHGWRGGQGVHRDFLMQNVVLGHLHVGNCSFRNYNGRTFFELNAGYAADPESKGLSYTPSKTTGWTLGWASIDEYGPRFIPFR